jgi:hypothetical protein
LLVFAWKAITYRPFGRTAILGLVPAIIPSIVSPWSVVHRLVVLAWKATT